MNQPPILKIIAQARGGWHWPVFGRAMGGETGVGESLGLPDHYVDDRFGDAVAVIHARLLRREPGELVQICENARAPLIERVVAGNLLAMLGDPRIDTLNPAMIDIEGGEVRVGLEHDRIEHVLREFAGLGLQRTWLERECPRRSLQLRSYRIARFPVTQREYRDFLLDTGFHELPSSWAFRRYPRERSNHPVYSISPAAADTYAAWLARKTGRGFRLPTEAEWEYAAAGPRGLVFPWGDEFRADRANTAETGLFDTTPAGIFLEGYSPFGAADMAGNVEEYVTDAYDADAGHSRTTTAGLHIVREGHAEDRIRRIARGGSFARFRDLARTSRRGGPPAPAAVHAAGFRLAEDI
jgi:formylglycine-generating enzyme required for sulfatase activity